MPRIAYEPWTPKADARRVIQQAAEICADYQQQGYDLTLRQLYYQFVARGLIENTDRSYKRLGSIVNRARMAGLLDWDYIVDRTRNLRSIGHYENPAEIIDVATRAYRLDMWEDQPVRVEVWVEKEALAGVIEQVAGRLDCAWFSCRGYVSQSEIWGAARRHLAYITGGQRVVVLHLGDHDPSGIDMTRDMASRLDTFTTQDYLNAHAGDFDGDKVSTRLIREAMAREAGGTPALEVHRIALTWDQVQEYQPPPNPAKMTDSRVEGYIDAYGTESWELDALDPSTLSALVEDHVLALRDEERWEAMEELEEEGQSLLRDASARWSEVVDFLMDVNS